MVIRVTPQSEWSALPVAEKPRLIVENILAQMRSGALPPGDRLPGIGRMRKDYGASQAVVESAIAWLEENGAISVSRRRGCFVSDKTPPPASDGADLDADRTAGRRHLDFYSRPRAEQRSLSVYLTEIFPRNLALWREELTTLKRRLALDRLEVYTCRDGHIQDLWQSHGIDVALIDQRVVPALGADALMELDAAQAGLEPTRFTPLVRQALEDGSLRAAPFSLVLQHLFVNHRLAEEFQVRLDAAATFPELLRIARAAQPGMHANGKQTFRSAGRLCEMLIANGALRCTADGRLAFAEQPAMEVLQALAGSRLEGIGHDDDIEDFAAGRSLCLLHCTYQTLDLATRVRFPFAARRMPLAQGVLNPADLMVFGVRRDAGARSEAVELVRHFSSHEVQRRFALIGGNLPVEAAAAADEEVLRLHPIGRDLLIEQAACSTLRWPVELRHDLARKASLYTEELALAAGTMTPEQVLAKLQLALAGLTGGAPPHAR